MEVISKPSLGCNESPEPASFGLLLYPPGQQTRRAVLPPDCSGERILWNTVGRFGKQKPVLSCAEAHCIAKTAEGVVFIEFIIKTIAKLAPDLLKFACPPNKVCLSFVGYILATQHVKLEFPPDSEKKI